MAATTDTAQHNESGVTLPVLKREKLILNDRSYHWITDRICGIVENKQPFLWWLMFIPASLIALIGVGGGLFHLVSTGVGVWGNTNRVMWGWPIVNFVFWIGIGHAGTLISAILFLTRQNWRTSINRAAEAMTIFAVMCAGIFPAFHVGRVWIAWFLAPIPERQRRSGRTSNRPSSGTCSRFPPTFTDFPDLLVPRHGSRPRHHPRPLQARHSEGSSTAFSPSVGAVATASGATTKWPTCSSRPSRPR